MELFCCFEQAIFVSNKIQVILDSSYLITHGVNPTDLHKAGDVYKV